MIFDYSQFYAVWFACSVCVCVLTETTRFCVRIERYVLLRHVDIVSCLALCHVIDDRFSMNHASWVSILFIIYNVCLTASLFICMDNVFYN